MVGGTAGRRVGVLTRSPRRALSLWGGAALLWLLSSTATGYSYHATIDVDRPDDPSPGGLACTGAANDCSLRAAVIKANTSAGPDTIKLPAGGYKLTIASTDDEYNFAGAVATTGDLDIFDNDGNAGSVSDLTIAGAGSGVTIIQAAPDAITTPVDRIFDVENVYGSPSAEGLHFTLSGVTLRYGAAPTLTTLDGPFPETGGAINFDGCKFAGVACTSRGILTLSDVIIDRNSAGGPGGGIYAQNAGGIALSDVRFTSNASGSEGGGLYHLGSLDDGNITIVAGGLSASSFTSNTAAGSGGGLRLGLLKSTSSVTITNTTFTTNVSNSTSAVGGGAITIQNARAVTITGGSFVSNTARSHGGAIFSDASASTDVVTLSGVDLRNNTADSESNGSGDGGAIYAADGEVRLIGSLVRGNAAVNGAGIAALSTTGNPKLTLRNSTFSGNLAKTLGGAVFFNNAVSPGGNTATLTNVTIAANHANTSNAAGTTFGGGLARSNGTVTVENSIIAGNFRGLGTAADDGKSTAGVTANFSLIQLTADFVFGGANNITGADPRLGALQDNGGTLFTHALLAGSPALDAGSNALATTASLTTDQRGTGFARTRDAADADTTATVDIGAYEAHPSIQDIADQSINEDTLAAVTFNVGDSSAGIASVTGVSSNTALVANASVVITGSGSTRTVTMTPVANAFGTTTITVTATATVSGSPQSMTDTFVLTVLPIADLPAITGASTNEDTQTASGLVATRNVADGAEVTHFKITSLTNGTLFKNNGSTSIANNEFITFAEANAGLKFTPAANKNSPAGDSFSFAIAGATSSGGAGLGPSATATITVTSIADPPTISAATTNEDTQSSSGLGIGRNAADGSDVTHFKITAVTNGTLFQSDGTTAITNNAFITFAEGQAGLKFTPSANLYSSVSSFGFTAAGALDASGTGLGAGTAASITVTPIADAPTISATTTNEDTQSSSGLVIARNAADDTEVTHFKITGITGGTLFKSNGSTAISNNDFITFAEGNAGLKFTPAANAFSPGTSFTFTAAGATNGSGAGLGTGTAASISVTPVADAPAITAATTNEDTQTSSGLVISRNAVDDTEVTHFKITGIAGGTLFKNDGTSQINNNDVISVAEGSAGLKFTPAANAFSPATSFGFNTAGATSSGGAGLGVATPRSITITPIADTPSITSATTTMNVQTSSGLVISRNAVDGDEVTHFQIGTVLHGTLFKNDGTTLINEGDYITAAEGGAGLKFTPASGQVSPSETFTISFRAATSASGTGLSPFGNGTIYVGQAFTDNVMTTDVTTIRAVHITELRTRINTQRIRYGLAAATWTDPTLTVGSTGVKTIHITELRTALTQAYAAALQSPPIYTESDLTPGTTTVKRIHIMDLRLGVAFLESR